MRAKPAPPSAGPRPIAAGRARVAASPHVTSGNLATPQPSLRSRRRARSQYKMAPAAAASAAGEERASQAPSSAPSEPGPEHRAWPAGRPINNNKNHPQKARAKLAPDVRVAGEGRVALPLRTPSPRRPPFHRVSPSSNTKRETCPSAHLNQLRSLRRRPPQRAKPRPLATRAAMKKPRSEKPCPQSEPLTYRTGSLAPET